MMKKLLLLTLLTLSLGSFARELPRGKNHSLNTICGLAKNYSFPYIALELELIDELDPSESAINIKDMYIKTASSSNWKQITFEQTQQSPGKTSFIVNEPFESHANVNFSYDSFSFIVSLNLSDLGYSKVTQLICKSSAYF